MIKEVSGDIRLSKADAIAHGVAPHDHFDSGLALSLRQDYPVMVKDFRHWCHVSNPKPGSAWFWPSADGRHIISLLTQEPASSHGHGGHPGNASLTNVAHALKEMNKIIRKEGLRSIALPRLATGVGGLDWADVRPLVYSAFEDAAVDVYIYTTFVKDKSADE